MIPTPEDARLAFQLFLGRDPRPETAAGFTSFDAMLDLLLHSSEFRDGARSRKTKEITWPEAQYFIARDRKILYCPIGKNACSFLKAAMVRVAEHPQEKIILHSVHLMTDMVRTGLQLSDYDPARVAGFLADPEMFSFALLRDPARRLLSAYVEKFVQNRLDPANLEYHTSAVIHQVQAEKGLAAPDARQGISFRDLVEFVVSQPPETLDAHWRPQYLYLADHRWSRLYLFDELPLLISDLEARTGVPLDGPPVNRSGSGLGADVAGADRMLPPELDRHGAISARSFLTDDLREKIEAYYQRDHDLIATAGT